MQFSSSRVNRVFIAVAVSAACVIGGVNGSMRAAENTPTLAKRPNVLVIVTDDMGYNDFGFQGSKDIPTPNLDSLANCGVRFSNAYVTAPICGASRAALLGGQYQQRQSYESNPRANQGLSLKVTTLAEALHADGYATGAVGKWSVGTAPEFRPQQRGFDEFFGFLAMMHAYVPGTVDPSLRMIGENPRAGWGTSPAQASGGQGAGARGERSGSGAGNRGGIGLGAGGEVGRAAGGGQQVPGAEPGHFVRDDEDVLEDSYATEAFAREAVGFIDRHKDNPFFLYLAFNASHSPLQPPQKYVDRFPNLTGKRQLYAATTSAMDDAVGQVVEKLRHSGQEENTIVVFINDNGGPINDIAANNAPLSGAKSMLWEGGIRVPLFVKWTGHVTSGALIDVPVISLDVFPTLLAATKIDAPTGQLEGTNLLPLLSGQPDAELDNRTLYWRFGNLWAIREGQWKLVVPQRGVEKPLLFNLRDDIGENNNLADQNPDVVQRLKEKWNAWNTQNLPVPANGFGGGQSAAAAKGDGEQPSSTADARSANSSNAANDK